MVISVDHIDFNSQIYAVYYEENEMLNRKYIRIEYGQYSMRI